MKNNSYEKFFELLHKKPPAPFNPSFNPNWKKISNAASDKMENLFDSGKIIPKGEKAIETYRQLHEKFSKEFSND